MIDLVNVVHAIACVVTMLQFVTEFVLLNEFKEFWLNDYCKTCPTIQFLGIAVASVLHIQYGNMLQDGTMIRVYTVGLLVSIALMCAIYYRILSNFSKAKYMIGYGAAVALTCVILCYVRYEDPKELEFRFGIIRTVVQLLIIAPPLICFGFIGVWLWGLSFMLGFAATLSWMLYGILLGNHTLVIEKISATVIYIYIFIHVLT
ncbi:uncharacterized protein LOC128745847 [Sabethes cyaneus]|uniref:uncharacterized protein LOC128745847 n=1 Tax=Sabethes cyaneus TaxID=53552 RepID=UPI00237E981F|nr:uncharacterized protein LOC128745847 [Sabethes cyaneus]